jgi:hypothetical protein
VVYIELFVQKNSVRTGGWKWVRADAAAGMQTYSQSSNSRSKSFRTGRMHIYDYSIALAAAELKAGTRTHMTVSVEEQGESCFDSDQKVEDRHRRGRFA